MMSNSVGGVSNVPRTKTNNNNNNNNNKQLKKNMNKKKQMNRTKSKKKRLPHNNDDDDDEEEEEAKQSVMNLRRRSNNNRILYLLITFIMIAIIATTIVTTTSSVTTSSSSSSSSSTTTTTTTTTTTKSLPATRSVDTTVVKEADAAAEEEVPPPSMIHSIDDSTSTIMTDNWTLLKKYAHDPFSFTQGLEVVPFHIASTLFDNYKAQQQRQHKQKQQQQQQQQQEQEEEEECNAEDNDDDDGTCNRNTNVNDNTNDDTTSDNPPQPLLVVESTGMYGDSLIRIWEPTTGTIIKETRMNQTLFGEGLCFYTDTLIEIDGDDTDGINEVEPVERDLYVQLTYREQTILIYDAHTLELLKTIQTWPSETTTKEGWGITYNPTEKIFYVTDGSDYIHYWNRQFQEIRPKQRVYINELITYENENDDQKSTILWPRKEDSTSYPINYINELEYDITTNTILANKIFDDIVLRIDPETGLVLTVYNFNSPNGNDKILYPKSLRTNKKKTKEVHQNSENNNIDQNNDIELELVVLPEPDVFNGIAIIPNTDGKEWLLTGKYWNTVYHIRINE